MGDHYAPRKYLEGFCLPETPQRIWVYDRKTGKNYCANIQKVAQEKGFYSEQDEEALNTIVEQPANAALSRLRAQSPITRDDRVALAAYMGTFLYRVPFHREHSIRNVAPVAFKETIAEARQWLMDCRNDPACDREAIDRRLAELDEVEAKHSPNPAGLISETIRSPWPHPGICQLILDMTWRFVVPKNGLFFVTSDNPLFLFGGRGLRNPDSEFAFPVSSTLAIHGNWQPGGDGKIAFARNYMVGEMNRRTASRAHRFLYCRQRANWIWQLSAKEPEDHFLSQLVWTPSFRSRQTAG